MISTGLVWRHFDNKAGLLGAVVDDLYDRYDDAVHGAKLLPGGSWSERERLRLSLTISFHLADPLTPAILGRLRRLEHHVLTAAATNIRRGQRTGEIPTDLDSDLLAGMIIGGLHHALTRALDAPAPPAAEHITSTLWDAVAAVLRLR